VQSKLREYCKKKGIKVISYSPLGSPGRLDKVDNEVDILTDAIVKEIATAHNITPAQVCISYMLHLGDGTIPKSMDEGHLKENYEVLNIQLTSDEIDKLKKLDSGFRRNTYDWIYFSKFASDEAAWDVEADSKFVFN
jgi:diketogulonate reductase-like aldo/keto reductase